MDQYQNASSQLIYLEILVDGIGDSYGLFIALERAIGLEDVRELVLCGHGCGQLAERGLQRARDDVESHIL